MNTGLLRPAVATVLTVYGIETTVILLPGRRLPALQQSLPFTVLKQYIYLMANLCILYVATVLTVYGIETTDYLFS